MITQPNIPTLTKNIRSFHLFDSDRRLRKVAKDAICKAFRKMLSHFKRVQRYFGNVLSLKVIWYRNATLNHHNPPSFLVAVQSKHWWQGCRNYISRDCKFETWFDLLRGHERGCQSTEWRIVKDLTELFFFLFETQSLAKVGGLETGTGGKLLLQYFLSTIHWKICEHITTFDYWNLPICQNLWSSTLTLT